VRYLRSIRWGVASLSIVFIAIFFLDFGNVIPPFLISTFLTLQAGSAVMKAIGSGGIAFIGLAIVFIATALVGRVYCSHLCPLGTLQDIFIWTAKKNFKHRKFPYTKPPYLIHYGITFIMIATAFCGSMILLNLFEPFSSFGRIISTLFRPLFVLLNNVAVSVLTKQQIYLLYEIPLKSFALFVFSATLIFIGGLYWLSYFYGRFFCNTLCPVGGVLSLLSRASLFRITIEKDKCNDCGLCERVCRARCIDSKNRNIDFAACVGCFDCVSSCPTLGLKYAFNKNGYSAEPPVDQKRRRVIVGASTGILSMIDFPQTAFSESSAYEKSRKTPVVAPGARSIERFTNFCSSCHLCVSSCPTCVLQPSFLEYGIAGIMQPRMDYTVNYCSYECTLCGQVCPTGAIQALLPDEKKLVQIGKTQFVKEDCIVETKKTDCGACSEHCPTKAVKMVPYGKLFLPEIDNQYCVGCGACEHACPTKPRKAIFVQSSPVHGVAKKRQDLRLESPISTPQEFPF
jgi:polyferredoxin